MELPVWQELYDELNDPNFEIICVAEDSQGESAASRWFDKTELTYRCVVDETHKISTLFGWVNVPSAAWIDEDGRIVRINEGGYAGEHTIKKGPIVTTFGNSVFGDAVKDWVRKGAESRHIWSEEQVRDHLKPMDDTTLRADAIFKLGLHLESLGKRDQAEVYFEQARELCPNNWNYHRQSWTFVSEMHALQQHQFKVNSPGHGRYYDPLEIDGEAERALTQPKMFGSAAIYKGLLKVMKWNADRKQ